MIKLQNITTKVTLAYNTQTVNTFARHHQCCHLGVRKISQISIKINQKKANFM